MKLVKGLLASGLSAAMISGLVWLSPPAPIAAETASQPLDFREAKDSLARWRYPGSSLRHESVWEDTDRHTGAYGSGTYETNDDFETVWRYYWRTLTPKKDVPVANQRDVSMTSTYGLDQGDGAGFVTIHITFDRYITPDASSGVLIRREKGRTVSIHMAHSKRASSTRITIHDNKS